MMQMQQESSKKHTLVKYVATVVVGLVIALLFCILKGLFKTEDKGTVLRILCDAFTVPGILLTCVGLLTLVIKEGALDGITYSFSSMRRVRRGYVSDEKTPKTYYDYKEAAKGKRKIAWHLIIVGLGFIAVAIALVIIRNSLT